MICSCMQFGSASRCLSLSLALGHLESLSHPLRSVTLLTSNCASLIFRWWERNGEIENLIDVMRLIFWDLQCFWSTAHCRFWWIWPHILSNTHGQIMSPGHRQRTRLPPIITPQSPRDHTAWCQWGGVNIHSFWRSWRLPCCDIFKGTGNPLFHFLHQCRVTKMISNRGPGLGALSTSGMF